MIRLRLLVAAFSALAATHALAQAWSVVGIHRHTPDTHDAPRGHARLHAPQCSELVRGSTQAIRNV